MRLRVSRDADFQVTLLALAEQRVVREREKADLVERVRCVRDQLAEEDFCGSGSRSIEVRDSCSRLQRQQAEPAA